MNTDDLLPPKTTQAADHSSENAPSNWGGDTSHSLLGALPPNVEDLRTDHLIDTGGDQLVEQNPLPPMDLDLPASAAAPAPLDPLAPTIALAEPLGGMPSSSVSGPLDTPASPAGVGHQAPTSIQLSLSEDEFDDPAPAAAPPKKKGLLGLLAGKPKPTPIPVPHAQPSQPNAGQDGRQSFVRKHKAPLAIAVALAAVMGWQYQQQIQQSAMQALQQVTQQNDPYELALHDMQTAPEDADDAPLPLLAGGDAELDIFSEGAEAAFPGEPALEAGAPPPEQVSADSVVAGQASPAPVEPAAEPAAEEVQALAVAAPAPAPAPKLEQELQETRQALEAARSEIQSLKQQLQAAMAAAPKPAARSAPKPNAKPAVASRPTAKPAPAKPSVQPATKPQVAAAPRRSDIEFLGAFRDKGQVKAHALIGNSVMELAQGQYIKSLRLNVEAVSMEGVTINGHYYR